VGWGSWERGHPAPPHQLQGLGEHCKLSQRGAGLGLGRPSGFVHFIYARWLFLESHYIAEKVYSQHFGGRGEFEPVTLPPKYGPKQSLRRLKKSEK